MDLLNLQICFFLSCCVLAINGLYPLKFKSEADDAEFQEFMAWCAQHGKVYNGGRETEYRFSIYKYNMAAARKLNNERMTSQSAVFGATQFADMTSQEFKAKILMTSYMPANRARNPMNISSPRAPEKFDWTDEKSVVTPVRNQGQAGTCWAFAGLANVEALWSRKTGSISPVMSTQALNDCDGLADPDNGALACGALGATMPGFYRFLMQEEGVMKEEDYPYCSGDGGCQPCAPIGYSEFWCGAPWPVDPCKADDSCSAKYDVTKFIEGLKVKDYVYFSSDEAQLQEALVETGPLVAGIDATDMQLYQGGILQPKECNAEALNHAVLLTGYDVSGDDKFWRAKNSWGTGWGEDGYLRIQYGEGACGINSDCSSARLG